MILDDVIACLKRKRREASVGKEKGKGRSKKNLIWQLFVFYF